MSKWINVKDDLPKDTVDYLIINDRLLNMIGSLEHHSKTKWFVDGLGYVNKITHWQELPPPPKEGE